MDSTQPPESDLVDGYRKEQLHQQLTPRQVQQHEGHQADYIRSASTDAVHRSQSQPRPILPTRSSTVGTPDELERRQDKLDYDVHLHARSEDLNHHSQHTDVGNPISSSSGGTTLQTLSRPITPNDSRSNASSSSTHSENGGDSSTLKRLSATSLSSVPSAANSKIASSVAGVQSAQQQQPPGTVCAACSLPLEGAFVRALGNVWHLPCFKCKDCDAVVASKFFPIEGPDGKQQPLCERDYFGRLNLICAKCQQALRGSYITACNKKYHVEHFTCSVCPTVFGPQDSYYEHENDVYCHYHYSTRFATKCAGCNSAILKQFVEINRNNRDECWHPECYMINKFWNVKVSSRRPTSASTSGVDVNEPAWQEEEDRETAQSLKDKQVRMEQQVYRIWTVLSAFEESSAACISDMLRQVSNGQYLEAIRMAEKFILHVEVLFATIDDLETCFARLNLKGMSHVREARLLCRKTVDLFTLLSRPQESQKRTGMTQELLALVTGLAHYLKILIRIALTGSLKLERDYSVRESMTNFLDKLHLLAVEGGNPGARRMMRGSEQHAGGYIGAPGTQGVTYGFRSLAPELAGDSPFWESPDSNAPLSERLSIKPPSDLCVDCEATVEEDCARLGTYQRWHSYCLKCKTCGKAAAPPLPKESPPREPGTDEKDAAPAKISTVRRPPANVDFFVYEKDTVKETPHGPVPTAIFCVDHQHPGCVGGFKAVSRLEQYAFLLNVALRRLSYLLKKRGLLIPPTPTNVPQDPQAYRDSQDIMRMKSVQHIERKSSAIARQPKRSTILESPSGKTAQPTNVANVVNVTQRGPGVPQMSQQAQPQTMATSATVPVRPPRPPQVDLRSPPMSPPQGPVTSVQTPRPRLGAPGPLPGSGFDEKGQIIRPGFARNNTGVMIVDDSVPTSPTATGNEEPPMGSSEDGITLADIPQLIEAEEARKQRRSLPSQGHVPLVAELTPLEQIIIKHSALLALSRSPIKNEFELDDLLEFIEVKKNNFWNKFFKQNKQKKGVFGVPLEILVEREGADSNLGASRATLRVPSFIDDVISAMRQMDMSVEGIFRKNGNIRRLNELTDAIDRDPSSVDLTQDNPVQLAALLKKFLKSLPEPLMTYKLYRLFMAAENLPNEVERKRCLHLVTLLLPKCNRDTVEVLFTFLKWVASFSHVDEETGNKMDLHNLATVISPNIFRSSPAKGTDIVRVESFESIRVMDSLLEYQDEFYQVPEDFLSLLRDQEYFGGAMELPSKEFLKKCEAYHRVRSNGRTPQGLTSPIQSSSAVPFTSVMSREHGDPRFVNQQQKMEPPASRGRQPNDAGPPGTAPPLRNGSYNVDRNFGPGSPEPPAPIRNGYSSRQQSPQPQSRAQHQSFAHASSAGHSSGTSQHGHNAQDQEWIAQQQQQQQQQQWSQPMSPLHSPQIPQTQIPPFAPSSSPRAYTPRNSGEHLHGSYSQANGLNKNY